MDNLAQFPLVERRVTEIQAAAHGDHEFVTTDAALERIASYFNREGAFTYTQRRNLLVNGSGEEFAIQFMSAYNLLHPGTY